MQPEVRQSIPAARMRRPRHNRRICRHSSEAKFPQQFLSLILEPTSVPRLERRQTLVHLAKHLEEWPRHRRIKRQLRWQLH
jgi:hypothetical protein